MKKRATALALWFACGWTLGGFLAWLTGYPEHFAISFGIAAALIVTVHPRTSALRFARPQAAGVLDRGVAMEDAR